MISINSDFLILLCITLIWLTSWRCDKQESTSFKNIPIISIKEEGSIWKYFKFSISLDDLKIHQPLRENNPLSKACLNYFFKNSDNPTKMIDLITSSKIREGISRLDTREKIGIDSSLEVDASFWDTTYVYEAQK